LVDRAMVGAAGGPGKRLPPDPLVLDADKASRAARNFPPAP
jgi:hypothetical protein